MILAMIVAQIEMLKIHKTSWKEDVMKLKFQDNRLLTM
jgi:hypothetical protein